MNNEIDFEDLAKMIPQQLNPIFEHVPVKIAYAALLKSLVSLGFGIGISENDQILLYLEMIRLMEEQLNIKKT